MSFGFEFKKALGQNFLIDGNIIRKIAEESGITKDTTVMEIGPGIGTLTEELAKHAKKVIAFELDESLREIHKETLGPHDNAHVIYKDFMDASEDEIKDLTGGAFKVCANLPYYVTTPILTFLLESKLEIDSITVMVQKEVAQRIVADEKSKDYGSISVFTRAYGDARIAFNVSKDCFYPKPKVDSAVLYIKKEEKDLANEELFLKIIRASFMKRRKTLANALFNSEVGIDKKDTVNALKTIGKGENARAEELSFDDFVNITKDLEGIYGNKELTQEELDAIKNDTIDYKIVERLADIMKALSEPSRIQIIHALSLSEMCVTDLSYALNMTQPLVSHHLRILRNLGLVKYERDGKALIYSLDDEHVLMLYKQGLEHAKEKVQ